MKIVIIGARKSGKSAAAQVIAEALRQHGARVIDVRGEATPTRAPATLLSILHDKQIEIEMLTMVRPAEEDAP